MLMKIRYTIRGGFGGVKFCKMRESSSVFSRRGTHRSRKTLTKRITMLTYCGALIHISCSIFISPYISRHDNRVLANLLLLIGLNLQVLPYKTRHYYLNALHQ